MNQREKNFRNFFYGIVASTMCVFVIMLITQWGSLTFKDNILTSISIAGFIGLFGQFALTLLQEYYERKTYKVCMICKKSQFSTVLSHGVQDYYSEMSEVQLTIRFIENNSESERRMNEFIINEGNYYDGIIIRPIDLSEDFIKSLQYIINRKKKVVLLDLNLNSKQQEGLYTTEIPKFVGSDFSLGGKLIAEFINDFVAKNGKENVAIILLLGPDDIPSARKRTKSLVWNICRAGNQDIVHTMLLNNFSKEDSISRLEAFFEKFNSSIDDMSRMNIMLFSGNDSIGKEILKNVSLGINDSSNLSKLRNVKNFTLIGYDGIMDVDDNYQLDYYHQNYATIDVLPHDQGRMAASVMYEMLMTEEKKYRTVELVKPKFVSNIDANNREEVS